MEWEIVDGTLHIGEYRAITWGIMVLFIGRWLVQHSAFLRNYNIPEPVVGGLLCSLVLTLLYFTFDIGVEFELQGRNVLLVCAVITILFGSSAKSAGGPANGGHVLDSGGGRKYLSLSGVGHTLGQRTTAQTVPSARSLLRPKSNIVPNPA